MEPKTLLVLLLVFTITSQLVHFITKKPIKDFVYKNVYSKVIPNQQIKHLIEVNKQLKDINQKRNAISAQDNYAQWTKLNREYTKLEKQAKSIESEINSHRSSIDSKLNWLILLLTSIPLQLIRLFYSRKQLLVLPAGVFPFYIEYIVNFPFLPRGTVGLLFISYALNSIISIVFNFIKFTFIDEKLPKPIPTATPTANTPPKKLESITE